MRIVVLGAVDFSAHCLREVIAAGGDVQLVLGLSPAHAHRHSDYVDLAATAAELDLRGRSIDSINAPETIALIRAVQPDLLCVFGWSQLVGPVVRQLPTYGCLGTHPALLPSNRGRHPLIWALIKGLPETGLTFFFLDEGVDSGDIAWQGAFPITDEDDAATLYDKVKGLASTAIPDIIPSIAKGTLHRRPQDHRLATYWRKRTEQDGEIDWTASSRDVVNLVRALTRPYVGAHTWATGLRLTIWSARPEGGPLDQMSAGPPVGTVLEVRPGSVRVRAGSGVVRLLDYEPALPLLVAGQVLGGPR